MGMCHRSSVEERRHSRVSIGPDMNMYLQGCGADGRSNMQVVSFEAMALVWVDLNLLLWEQAQVLFRAPPLRSVHMLRLPS